MTADDRLRIQERLYDRTPDPRRMCRHAEQPRDRGSGIYGGDRILQVASPVDPGADGNPWDLDLRAAEAPMFLLDSAVICRDDCRRARPQVLLTERADEFPDQSIGLPNSGQVLRREPAVRMSGVVH